MNTSIVILADAGIHKSKIYLPQLFRLGTGWHKNIRKGTQIKKMQQLIIRPTVLHFSNRDQRSKMKNVAPLVVRGPGYFLAHGMQNLGDQVLPYVHGMDTKNIQKTDMKSIEKNIF